MTENESMRDSGVEWINETPNDWKIERLKNHVRFAYGDSLSSDNRNDGNISVFGSNGIVGSHNQSITNGATIIIGRKGSFGKITWSDKSCFPIDTTYFVDKTKTMQNLRWLYYVLYSLQLDTVNFDSAVPGLSRETAYSLYLPFPTISQQIDIADYLDQRCAKLDSIIAIKQQQIQALDVLQRNTISETVTRGFQACELKETGNVWISEIPDHWKLVSLKRVCKIQTGFTLGKQYDEALIERPYLRVANVQDGHLNLSNVTTIEVPVDVASRVELRAGDVLMTEGGDLDKLGRGTVWNAEIPNCLHQNHIFAVRCFQHKLLPAFLAYLTTSRYGRDYFEVTGKRTTNLASTNSTKVGQFPIPLPPKNEQKEICDYLESKLSVIAKTSAGIEAQIATLEAYKKSLIYECVTGKKRIYSNDEKAAALTLGKLGKQVYTLSK